MTAALPAGIVAIALRGAIVQRSNHLVQIVLGHLVGVIGQCPIHFLAGNGNTDQLFDIAQIGTLLAVTERNRNAALARSSGTTNAVDIALRDIRQFKIDHMRNARHINAARSDIGRHQDLDIAGFEAVQRLLALILRLIAVNGRGLQARLD